MTALVNDELLKLLRCPETQSELQLADPMLLALANRQIAAGKLMSIGGHVIKKPLDGALVRAGGDIMYPIIEGIPVMLHDEAIAVGVLQHSS